MLPKTLLLTAAVVLAAAAPAAADSIAYVKDGDVWLASPDGARKVQVTHGGNYAYVSQSDAGEMIALAPGERLHKLSRSGKVLADFPTLVSDGAPQAGPVSKFHGPFNPEISPDGTKVAYEWFNDSYDNDTGCSETSVPPCYVYTQSQGVAISYADRYTGTDFGLLTGWIYPHWMSNDTLLRSFSGKTMTDDAVFTRVGPGLADKQLDPWFYDDKQGYGVDDVELSRDLKTVVGIAGESSEKLRTYRTLTAPFGAPDWDHTPFHEGNTPVAAQCSELTGAEFESTSLAPDGRGVAYGTKAGVFVAPLSGCQLGGQGALLQPGARFPDWGPADVPAAGSAKPSVRVARASRRRGIVLRVRTGGPGTVRAKALLRGRSVGSGTARIGASGAAKVRVKVKLRRRAKVAVKVAFRPAGGGATQAAMVRVMVR